MRRPATRPEAPPSSPDAPAADSPTAGSDGPDGPPAGSAGAEPTPIADRVPAVHSESVDEDGAGAAAVAGRR